MKAMKTIKKIDRQGLTLTELMISLAIFGVIMGVLFGFLAGARNSYSETRERAQYQQSMRAVMSLITREIRSAGCDPLDDNFNFDKFGVADAGQLQVRMDLNGDMDFADIGPDENVSYSFAGGNLTRDNGNGPQVILRGVQVFTFTYFDAVGAELNVVPLSAANRELVRFVGINIQGQTDRGEPVTYTTRIALRNG
ncbi:MAG: prepilin-type N-terminal cleavage/methylation domain-containing protein [Candidatus Krumholzibacteria bacterium]|nr:prepilin-type N-terminal cleavage/methylation domain-containing protein [Candidatus Krumholzibacteria bacterium]